MDPTFINRQLARERCSEHMPGLRPWLANCFVLYYIVVALLLCRCRSPPGAAPMPSSAPAFRRPRTVHIDRQYLGTHRTSRLTLSNPNREIICEQGGRGPQCPLSQRNPFDTGPSLLHLHSSLSSPANSIFTFFLLAPVSTVLQPLPLTTWPRGCIPR